MSNVCDLYFAEFEKLRLKSDFLGVSMAHFYRLKVMSSYHRYHSFIVEGGKCRNRSNFKFLISIDGKRHHLSP